MYVCYFKYAVKFCEIQLFFFNHLLFLSGATYGTGLAAVKLTALGRPQLLVITLVLRIDKIKILNILFVVTIIRSYYENAAIYE